jgi:zinc transport system permease protein
MATLLGAILSFSGLALSYGPDLPTGPTIILLAGADDVVSALWWWAFSRRFPPRRS